MPLDHAASTKHLPGSQRASGQLLLLLATKPAHPRLSGPPLLLPSIRQLNYARRLVHSRAGFSPLYWLAPSAAAGPLVSIIMVLVPGLDRLPDTALAGMPDDLWTQHTQQLRAAYAETDQSAPFDKFCAKYAGGELETAAMRQWALQRQAPPLVTSVALSVPTGAAGAARSTGLPGAPGPMWTRGDAEAPAGERSMGPWTARVYTEEQQGRLGLDEEGRPAWAKLLGRPGDEASAAIKMFNPGLCLQVVPQGNAVTCDFREDRVRIFVDGQGRVARAPKVG